MLNKAGIIPRIGTVDAGNTVSDFMPEEHERRASVYSSVMNCQWKDYQYYFTDNPGYAEFVGQFALSVRVADAALVVIDAVDGPQVGTARAWRMCKKRGIPRFGFVNRLDRDRADFKATLEVMRKNHGRTVIIPLYWPVGSEGNFNRVVNVLFDKDIPSEIADDVLECRNLWMDAIAENNETILDRYLGGEEIPIEELVREKTETLEQEEQAELEPFTLNITPADDTEDTYKPHRKVITLSEMTNGTKGVIENSLVRGTDNIYITEKKYILPIENLDNATYIDNLKGG
jgi:elongation factor G